jgi:hypothetical protein
MLEAKLTTCASLLYQWILPRVIPGTKLKVDLQDFQAWISEYREKSYSDREILDAFRLLKELQLITVSKTEVTLEASCVDNSRLNMSSNQLLLMDEEPSVATVSDRPNRFQLFLRISLGSLVLGLTSVSLGLALVQMQPQVLNTPNPWSVLGEKNIGSGN